MKYKIKSFILGVREARGNYVPSFMVGPLKEHMIKGRKLSNRFMDLLKFRMG